MPELSDGDAGWSKLTESQQCCCWTWKGCCGLCCWLETLAPPLLTFSFCPSLRAIIILVFPSGGLAAPITLLLLPRRENSLSLSLVHSLSRTDTYTHTHSNTVTVGSPHYQSMSLAASDYQVYLILLFFFLLTLSVSPS